jgi:hypothetical protein
MTPSELSPTSQNEGQATDIAMTPEEQELAGRLETLASSNQLEKYYRETLKPSLPEGTNIPSTATVIIPVYDEDHNHQYTLLLGRESNVRDGRVSPGGIIILNAEDPEYAASWPIWHIGFSEKNPRDLEEEFKQREGVGVAGTAIAKIGTKKDGPKAEVLSTGVEIDKKREIIEVLEAVTAPKS